MAAETNVVVGLAFLFLVSACFTLIFPTLLSVHISVHCSSSCWFLSADSGVLIRSSMAFSFGFAGDDIEGSEADAAAGQVESLSLLDADEDDGKSRVHKHTLTSLVSNKPSSTLYSQREAVLTSLAL